MKFTATTQNLTQTIQSILPAIDKRSDNYADQNIYIIRT